MLTSFILFFLISCDPSKKPESKDQPKSKDQIDEFVKVKRYACESEEMAINFVISEPATKGVSGEAPPTSAVCSLNYSGPNINGSYHGGNSSDCENELLKLMNKYKSQNYACRPVNTHITPEPEEKEYLCENNKRAIAVNITASNSASGCSVNYLAPEGKTGTFNHSNMSYCKNELQEIMDKFSAQYHCYLNDNSIEAALSELQGQINYLSPRKYIHQDIKDEARRQFNGISQRTANGIVIVSCLCRDPRMQGHPRFPFYQEILLKAGGVNQSEVMENVTTICDKYSQHANYPHHIVECITKTFNPDNL